METSYFKKKSERSVYNSIFMSYILSAVVTLAVCGLGFFHFYRYISDDVFKTAQRQALLSAQLIEQQCTTTQNLLEVLSNDTTFKKFTDYDDDEFHRQNYEISKFRTNVMNNASIFQYCNDVYFYFINSDSLFGLNTRRYSSDMIELFFTSTPYSREEFYRLIDFKGLGTTAVLDNGSVLFMRSCYNDERERVAVIIADVKLSTVVNQMHQFYPDNSLVIASNDTVLLSSAAGIDIPLHQIARGLSDSNVQADSLIKIKYKGDNYRTLYQRVNGIGWSCYVIIPENNLLSGLLSFWRVALLLSIAAITITIVMARRLTSRTYAPVKQIIALMHEEGQGEFPETYENLIKALSKLKKENHELHSTDREYRMKQIQSSVRQILHGEITETAVIHQVMNEWIHHSEDDPFCIGLIHISVEEGNHVFELNDQGNLNADSVDLMEFVLRNILDERLFSKFQGDLLSDGSDYVIFVHCSKANHNQVNECINECMAFLRQSMKTNPIAVISDCIQHFDVVSQMYATLADELMYHQFWQSGSDTTSVIQLGNLDEYADKFSNDRYVMFTSRLMNYLEVQDFIAAWRTLEEIIDTTFPKDRKYLKQNLYRMYGLIGTIATFMDIPDSGLLEKENYEEKLFNVENITQFKQVIHELFEKIIEYKASTEDSAPVWVEQVDDYIKKNFRDINLTVSSLADTFDVSVSHLSRTFKQHTGTGALDRIHEMRIAAAKELLLKGVSVEETAQQCGYLDAKALRRAFTNYEGVTPGKFREAGIRRVLSD